MDVDEAEDTRSRKSRATTAARTARRSEWNEDVFSGAIHSFRRWLGNTCAASWLGCWADRMLRSQVATSWPAYQSSAELRPSPSHPGTSADSDDEGARTARTARTKLTEGGRSRGQQSRRAAGGAGLLAGSHAGADPVDLLDRGASRQLVAAAAGRGGQRRSGGDDGPDFGTDASGRMIIKVGPANVVRTRGSPCCISVCWRLSGQATVNNHVATAAVQHTQPTLRFAPPTSQDDRAAKRKRHDDGWDSEDSDFEDLKVGSLCCVDSERRVVWAIEDWECTCPPFRT